MASDGHSRDRASDVTRLFADGIIDAFQEVVYAFDAESNIRDYNDRLLEVTGYGPEKINEMKPWDFVPETERDRIERSVSRVLEHEERVRDTVHIKTRDGRKIPYELTATPMYDSEGEISGLVGVGRDVSDRKARERQLEEYEQIVETLPVGLFRTTPDGQFLAVNERYAEMMADGSRDAILATDPRELYVDPEDREEILDQLRTEGSISDWEVEVQSLNGEQFWVSTTMTLDEDGIIEGVSQDITERKERERELERKQDFLQQTQEVADVGGWEVDLQSDTLRWTEQVYHIHGVALDYEPTVDEAIELYHPDDREQIQNAVDRLMTDGEPYDLELRIVRPTDEVRWVRTQGKPWYDDGADRSSAGNRSETDDGDIIGARGTFQDITEQVERKQDLQTATDQLEVLNRILRHDIQNQTQVLELWIEQLDGQVDIGNAEEIEKIRQASRHIEEMTNNSKLLIETVTGETTLETEPTRLDDVLGDELEKTRSQHPDAEFTTPASLPAVSVSANGMVASVFRNLLNNAIKHNREQPHVEVTVETDPDTARVTIADDGPGIPDDQKAEIFGKGEHGLDNEGTGMGLYLVNTLVESYGGEVWVEDREGQSPSGNRTESGDRAEHSSAGNRPEADDDDPSGAVFVVELPRAGH